MNISIERIQHGVGQGGFHSCTIVANFPGIPFFSEKRPFDFVFDCGTCSVGPFEQKCLDFLSQHISTYQPTNNAVDALFISHLDEDHYQGTKKICETKNVSRIFLPYFSIDEAVLFAADLIYNGRSVGSDFIGDIINIARGSRNLFGVNVTIIGGDERDDADPILLPVSSPRLQAVHLKDDGTLTSIGSNLKSGANIGLVTGNVILPWILRPWSYKQTVEAQERMTSLVDSIPELRGLRSASRVESEHINAIKANKGIIRSACTSIIKSKDGTHSKNFNAPSLCLYSGKRSGHIGPCRDAYVNRGSSEDILRHDPTGWITTGDCLLSSHWKDFRDCFADVLGNVGTYVLPHHGSEDNHSIEFVDAVPGRLAVICARSKSDVHPSKSVLNDIYEVGDVVKFVNEHTRHGFTERIAVDWSFPT